MNWAQRKLILDKLNFEPTAEQLPIMQSDARIRLVAGGEQSGKSFSSEKDLMSRLLEGQLFWLVAADYARTGREWGYLQDDLMKLKIPFKATKDIDPGEMIIADKIRVQTKSAKDPRKLAMEAPNGILVCEASQVDYETYMRVIGRTAPTRGWVLLSGTFESSLGWYTDLWQKGQLPNKDGVVSFSLPSWSNKYLYPGGRDDPEIKRLEAITPPEFFMERYGGVPCPPKGIVFPEFKTHLHVGEGDQYEYDPSMETYLWVDPGFASAYAVLAVQKRGESLWVVDEIYERGMVTSDVVKVAKQRHWWNSVVGGAIDIAGTQHQAMPAPSEIWLQEGYVFLRSQKLSITDGIEQVKRFLLVNPVTGHPLLHINSRCKGLISEFGGCENPITHTTQIYSWRMDKDGNVLGDVPEDKYNHAVKALSYGIVDTFGYTTATPTRTKVHFY